VQDQRVGDLVDPVGEPQGEPGEDDVVAAALGLLRVDVEDERQQGDRVPLEGRGVAQQLLRLAGEVGDRGDRGQPKAS
jgi:hypothetical protein